MPWLQFDVEAAGAYLFGTALEGDRVYDIGQPAAKCGCVAPLKVNATLRPPLAEVDDNELEGAF